MTLRSGASLVVLLSGLASAVPSALAEDTRKVGSGYVISYRHLDLDQPADRRALLEQVEQSAARLCEDQESREDRDACADKAVEASIKAAPGRVRRAVKTARLERDGEQQAHR
jgi:UrcA family protein